MKRTIGRMIAMLLRRLRLGGNTPAFIDPSSPGFTYRQPGGGNDYYFQPGTTDTYLQP